MDRFYKVAVEQGWDTYSEIDVLLGFIGSLNLEEALAEYAEERARTENDG